jgi:hypothetical protein
MSETFVFEFYNLYLSKEYVNETEGIIIKPLKIAKEFEKNRSKNSSQYHYNCWKTAECQIQSDNDDEAKMIGYWLESIFSFAQKRSIFWYGYKKGVDESHFESRFVLPIENRSPDLIYGTFYEKGKFNRDISLFIDTAIRTLRNCNHPRRNEILTTINCYLTSHSQICEELQFLAAWICIEKLSKAYHYSNHNKLASNKKIFDKEEKMKIKQSLGEALDSILKDDLRASFLKKNLEKNYIYEPDTHGKLSSYLHSLDLGLDQKELEKTLGELVEIRRGLVHDLGE